MGIGQSIGVPKFWPVLLENYIEVSLFGFGGFSPQGTPVLWVQWGSGKLSSCRHNGAVGLAITKVVTVRRLLGHLFQNPNESL